MIYGSTHDAREELLNMLYEFKDTACSEKEFWPRLESLAVAGSKLLGSYRDKMKPSEQEDVQTVQQYLDHVLTTIRMDHRENYCTSDLRTLKQLVISFFEDAFPIEHLELYEYKSA